MMSSSGHQAARLAGGKDRCAGRVELWRDQKWGTVCDDQWDLKDADVACAQLGCGYALNVTGQDGPFPPGRGSIYLDEVNCTGKEGNLWACPSVKNYTDCGHKEDAGVMCSGHNKLHAHTQRTRANYFDNQLIVLSHFLRKIFLNSLIPASLM